MDWLGWSLVLNLFDRSFLFVRAQASMELHERSFRTLVTVQDAFLVQDGKAPAVSGIHHCLLEYTQDDRRSLVLLGCDDGVHLGCHPI